MLRLENKWDSHLVLFTGSNGFTSQKNKPFTHWCVPRSYFQVRTAHSNLSWLTGIISGIREAHICTLSMERLICREQCNRITSGWKTMFNVKKLCSIKYGHSLFQILLFFPPHWSFYSKVYSYLCTIQYRCMLFVFICNAFSFSGVIGRKTIKWNLKEIKFFIFVK